MLTGAPLSPDEATKPMVVLQALGLPMAISMKLPAQDLSLPLPTLEMRLLWAGCLCVALAAAGAFSREQPCLHYPGAPNMAPRRGNFLAVSLRLGSGAKCPGCVGQGRQWRTGWP